MSWYGSYGSNGGMVYGDGEHDDGPGGGIFGRLFELMAFVIVFMSIIQLLTNSQNGRVGDGNGGGYHRDGGGSSGGASSSGKGCGCRKGISRGGGTAGRGSSSGRGSSNDRRR